MEKLKLNQHNSMISKFYSTMVFNWITENTKLQQNLRIAYWFLVYKARVSITAYSSMHF